MRFMPKTRDQTWLSSFLSKVTIMNFQLHFKCISINKRMKKVGARYLKHTLLQLFSLDLFIRTS